MGGKFEMAGGDSANNIASWDGNSWSALGSGMDGGVNALTVCNGNLIAGGWFRTAGGTSANYIASWDSSTWSPLESGMSGGVRALTEYDSKLIAGGSFMAAGGQTAIRVASWDGNAWSPLSLPSSGFGPGVRALTTYYDKLIAGGDDGFETGWTFIYSWDGVGWSWVNQMGSEGWEVSLSALAVYDSKLIAGGLFPNYFPSYPNNIGAWDGTLRYPWSELSPLGSGTNGSVRALAEYDNKLFVGGSFTMAGGKVASGLAAWTKHCCVGTRGNVNMAGIVDLSDLSLLIAYLTATPQPTLQCSDAANFDGTGIVDLSDLSLLIAYLTATPWPTLPACP